VKKAYAAANRVLGDIIKVTPSSKVVGDLAQFMVQNNLSEEDVMEQAETLSFPQSVVEYFQGYLGIPAHGFPEPLRSKVLKGKTLPNGKAYFEGRPGAELEPFDFEGAKKDLVDKYGPSITDLDVISHVMYPSVFEGFKKFQSEYGDVDKIDTRTFVSGLEVGKEIQVEVETGKILYIKLIAVGNTNQDGVRDIIFELNGRKRVTKIEDRKASVGKVERRKAEVGKVGSVGAPMPGVIVEVRVVEGKLVEEGDPLVVLSAMKMETVVGAPTSGRVSDVCVKVGDSMQAGELVVEIDESGNKQSDFNPERSSITDPFMK